LTQAVFPLGIYISKVCKRGTKKILWWEGVKETDDGDTP